MNTLKNIAVVIGLPALFCAMIVGSLLDIGRPDPFTGNTEQDLEYCANTPWSLMDERELQRCDWLREEAEHPASWDDFDTDSSDELPGNYDDP